MYKKESISFSITFTLAPRADSWPGPGPGHALAIPWDADTFVALRVFTLSDRYQFHYISFSNCHITSPIEASQSPCGPDVYTIYMCCLCMCCVFALSGTHSQFNHSVKTLLGHSQAAHNGNRDAKKSVHENLSEFLWYCNLGSGPWLTCLLGRQLWISCLMNEFY